MILPGVASVTFRDKRPQEIIQLAQKAGLRGIEWGGDIHVPTGDLQQAARIGRLTRASGLQVSAYGSYYTVGKSRDKGFLFKDILDTAKALEAPTIRIWAGDRSSKDSTRFYYRKVMDETRGIADEAARHGLRLAFEFHDDTLNDTYESCCQLLTDLAHPQVKTYWQPRHGAGPVVNGAGIDMILPWIVGVHVFHWWPGVDVRLSLQEGAAHWKEYMARLAGVMEPLACSLEFVRGNSPTQFLEDANTLLELTAMN
ncbi:MAG: sugar phosphate isomerase/epimerase [Saprospiraceae bacterium]|nr:sugar phosphate isomerase/epimerase [Saprospiraceae bacterium]